MLPVDVIKTSRSQYPQILFVSLLFFIILPIILFLTVKNVYSIDIALTAIETNHPSPFIVQGWNMTAHCKHREVD